MKDNFMEIYFGIIISVIVGALVLVVVRGIQADKEPSEQHKLQANPQKRST